MDDNNDDNTIDVTEAITEVAKSQKPKNKKDTLVSGGMIDKELDEVLHTSMMPYSEYVILDRALPRVEDGLKPVQRRILFAMLGLGLEPDKPYRKSARIVGECLGKYHPHGDTSVYDAMVRMAQPHNMSEILVQGHGNFGSNDGDSAAAMRYTEAKLAPLAMELLRDLDKDTVSWSLNFDDTLKEPDMLPGRYPNLLVNGASGIAVGLATNIPTHNLGEVIDGVVAYIDKPTISLKEIMQYIKAPDFPTGGAITLDELTQAYETGKGKVMMYAKYHIETTAGDKKNIVITELPYQVNKAKLLQTIAVLRDEKKGKLADISDVRDESDRQGMRAVVVVKKDGDVNGIIDLLLKYTDMRCSFAINMVAIAGGKPQTMGLLDIIKYYVNYQKEVIIRRSKYDLAVAKERCHILEGLLIAIKNIDAVIAIIKKSASPIDAKMKLKDKFLLSDRQAQAILDMRLARLTNLEVNKISDEIKELKIKIDELNAIIKSNVLQFQTIKNELLEIKRKYKTPRRTQILNAKQMVKIETVNLDAPVPVVLVLTNEGYLKNIDEKTFDNANKDIGTSLNLNNTCSQILRVKSDKKLLAFTNKGYVMQFTASELKQCRFKDKGISPREAFVDFALDEKIIKIIEGDFNDNDLLFFTAQGYVKRTAIKEYDLQKAYAQGIKLREDVDYDELINVVIDDKHKDMIFATLQGQVLYAKKDDVPSQGRVAGGVKGVNLNEADFVIYGDICDDNGELVVFTNKGLSKRIVISQIGILPRYRKGVKLITLGTDDEVIWATKVTTSKELIVKCGEEFVVKSTDKISIEPRTTKGKTIIKAKGTVSVFVNEK